MSLNRENLVITLLAIISILLWLGVQIVSITIYTETPQYLLDEQQIQLLHDRNLSLEDELLHYESYIFIASQSAKMGLTLPVNPILLK